MVSEAQCPEACRQVVLDAFAKQGVDAVVSTAPPIIPTPYDPYVATCPHGVVFYAEPTGEQRAAWARERVP